MLTREATLGPISVAVIVRRTWACSTAVHSYKLNQSGEFTCSASILNAPVALDEDSASALPYLARCRQMNRHLGLMVPAGHTIRTPRSREGIPGNKVRGIRYRESSGRQLFKRWQSCHQSLRQLCVGQKHDQADAGQSRKLWR